MWTDEVGLLPPEEEDDQDSQQQQDVIWVPSLRQIVSLFTLIYGGGVRKMPTKLFNLVFAAGKQALIGFVKFITDMGLVYFNTSSEAFSGALDLSEDISIDLNSWMEDLIQEHLGFHMDIPEFDFLKFTIPAFPKLAALMNRDVDETDAWFMMGFGPDGWVRAEDWVSDAAGYLLSKDILGSECLGDIISVIFPIIGIPRAILNMLSSFKEYAGKWNDIATEYNNLRAQLMLVLREARESIAGIVEGLAIDNTVMENLKSLGKYISIEQIQSWLSSAGIDIPCDFEALLDSISDGCLEQIRDLLDSLDIALSTVLDALDILIDTIEENVPEFPIIPEELLPFNIEFVEWDVFPQPGENVFNFFAENVAMAFGFIGLGIYNLVLRPGWDAGIQWTPPPILSEEAKERKSYEMVIEEMYEQGIHISPRNRQLMIGEFEELDVSELYDSEEGEEAPDNGEDGGTTPPPPPPYDPNRIGGLKL
jgi:hypothetical protein